MDINIKQLMTDSFLKISQETGIGTPETKELDSPFQPNTMISIGIIGDFHGFMFIQTTKENLAVLMKLMMEHLGYEMTDNDPNLLNEAFSEFANQLAGRLMMSFSEAGINGDITPPTVLQGENISMDLGGYPVKTVLEFSYTSGKIITMVGLKK